MQARIKDKRRVAEGTLMVTFDLLGAEVDFRAGQYFHLTLPDIGHQDERGLRRHITVVTSPNEKGVLGLATRMRDSAFKRSLDELPVGAEVEVDQPKGNFVLPEEASRPLVFVAGGIGITVFRSMLLYVREERYSEFLPEESQARGIQIDLDPKMIGIRYPMDVHLVGDSAETLRALIPLLERKRDRSWREKIEKNVSDWWRVMEERALIEADPINPQRVFWELSSRLPENCILTSDSGSAANWYARDLKLRRGMMASLSGTLATMGTGVPYAIAAKFAYPDRVAIALVGDGAMQMNGLNELITIAKYWERWSDPRLVVLVLNNRDLNMVTWEQRALEGDPKFEASQDIPDFPYARYAELLGLKGVRVDAPDEIGDAWDEVLAADRPAVLEAITDPEVPPLPPHISFEHARNFMLAIARGDKGWRDMIEQSLKAKLKEFAPGRS
jgi:hypothetical protein